MLKLLSKENIEAIRIRFNKYIDPKSIPYFDLMDLCDTVNILLEQNSILKENIFNIEQSVPEEKKWGNILAAKLQRTLNFLKEDYLEIINSINNDTYIITIQKKFGKTPEQKFVSSEIRRLKASKKIVNLLKEIRALQASNKKHADELFTLKKVYTLSKEEISLESREELSKIIEAVNRLINQFNSGLYRQNMKKLHSSMRDAWQEAWSRAIDAELALNKANVKLKQIKGEVLKKKYPPCRIYKKRPNKTKLFKI